MWCAVVQLKWLTKSAAPSAVLGAPTPSMLTKRSRSSVTLQEYIKNARGAARRKRKHTELKRSGVLEVVLQSESIRNFASRTGTFILHGSLHLLVTYLTLLLSEASG